MGVGVRSGWRTGGTTEVLSMGQCASQNLNLHSPMPPIPLERRHLHSSKTSDPSLPQDTRANASDNVWHWVNTQPVGAPHPLILNGLSLRVLERTATRSDVPGNISRNGKCQKTTGIHRYPQPCEKNQDVTRGCTPEKLNDKHRKQEKRESTVREQPHASRLAVTQRVTLSNTPFYFFLPSISPANNKISCVNIFLSQPVIYPMAVNLFRIATHIGRS